MQDKDTPVFSFDQTRIEPGVLASPKAIRSSPLKAPSRPQDPAWLTALLIASLAKKSVRRNLRLVILSSLDFFAIVGALALVLYVAKIPLGLARFELAAVFAGFGWLAVLSFHLSGLYRRSWRFLRFSDLVISIRSFLPGLIIAWIGVFWFLGISGIGMLAVATVHVATATAVLGSMRLARRLAREINESRQTSTAGDGENSATRVLLLGPPDWASSLIEVLHSSRPRRLNPVGALLTSGNAAFSQMSRIPVLGGPEMLASAFALLEERNKAPAVLVMADRSSWPDTAARANVISRAKLLGLKIDHANGTWSKLIEPQGADQTKVVATAKLLGRPEFSMEREIVASALRGRKVLVTGAGGTIGGELVRQLADIGAAELIMLDHSEHDLYSIDMKMRNSHPNLRFRRELCCIKDREALRSIFKSRQPEIVFHAAALKHVPIVEENPLAGVQTNVLGTRNVADAVCEFGVRAMIQVSTDKAVNPVGIMGATKRVGELYSQALDLCGVDDKDAPRFITVRFGNVLGSSGSIVPLFRQQIAAGQPLTVTHPDITRYFMTVKEAVHLILQTCAHAIQTDCDRGNIYVLDMGEPVKIYDLALQMVRLAGLEPDADIDIQFVGLRPGEKLYEELFDTCEEQLESTIPGIFEARSRPIPLPLLNLAMMKFETLIREGNAAEARHSLLNLVKIPNGSANKEAPFGDFGSVLAAFQRDQLTLIQSDDAANA